jgi:hypothetical protein
MLHINGIKSLRGLTEDWRAVTVRRRADCAPIALAACNA